MQFGHVNAQTVRKVNNMHQLIARTYALTYVLTKGANRFSGYDQRLLEPWPFNQDTRLVLTTDILYH